ncbi:MAG TPA: YceI family protein [Labilithrix sp.]
MNRWVAWSSLCIVVLSAGCDEKKEQPAAAPATTAAAATASAAAPAGSAPTPKDVPLAAGATRFAILMGKGTFLIDAPLEKIKGTSDELRGYVDVNPKDLSKTTGSIGVRLSTLRTSTFDDADKNAAQTEHARNWMEVGNDSPADSRMKYEWATLVVTAVEPTPSALADAKEENGARVVKAKVSGDLMLHGVTSKKTGIPVTVTFRGPADAPTELRIKTDAPMPVSMKEHDVKPRDKIGSFLNGALDRIGKKIDDNAQVSFETDAKATMPAHP